MSLRPCSAKLVRGGGQGSVSAALKRLSVMVALLLSVSAVSSAVAATSGEAEKETKRLVVAVVQSRNLEPYQEARKGFLEALEAEGLSCLVTAHDLEGDSARAAAVTNSIRASGPNLILTLGSLATREISLAISDIPIVFAMVLEPEASGLVPASGRTGRNLTGVKMDISPGQQLDAIRRVLPRAQRVGVLYSEESRHTLDAVRVASEKRKLELLTEKVASAREVTRAVQALSPDVDVLMAIPDATVYSESSAQYVLLHTLRQALPFVGLLESFVEAGALMGLGLDYKDLGRQAGELGRRIQEGEDVGKMQVEGPRRTSLLLNLRTARRIGVSIPAEIRQSARVVVP